MNSDKDKTTVTFLGTGSLIPPPPHDAPSVVVNRHVMVDTGYYGAQRMRAWGLSPGEIDTLLLTHNHPDHMLGLPLFFCLRAALPYKGEEVRPVTVVGPAGRVQDAVQDTCRFIGGSVEDRVREVVGLEPGDRYEAGELMITTCRARHPEPGLIYRLEDGHTGASVGLAWDTAPDAGVARPRSRH